LEGLDLSGQVLEAKVVSMTTRLVVKAGKYLS